MGFAVLIVDDIALFREGLAAALRRDAWVGEVRTAADGPTAVDGARSSPPDVVLLSMASRDGQTVRRLGRVDPAGLRPCVAGVDLDADWNEQQEILDHLRAETSTDLVGPQAGRWMAPVSH